MLYLLHESDTSTTTMPQLQIQTFASICVATFLNLFARGATLGFCAAPTLIAVVVTFLYICLPSITGRKPKAHLQPFPRNSWHAQLKRQLTLPWRRVVAMLTGTRPFSGPPSPFCLPVIAPRPIVLSIGAESSG
jgi:hypothetical protein